VTADKYSQVLDQLYSLEFFGMKLGLDNITELLAHLGDPQDRLQTIHVAGTNGKGSVSAMLAAAYQADGKKVGLYTSPHLVDFTERIRVNGAMIPREYVQGFLERAWPKVEELKATFFEVTTALAFDYFAHSKVDLAVIETGLGGRLDATNVLKAPMASVITSIGMDHMAQLGDTLEAIAGEKAGIIKRSVPAIVNCPKEVEHVFARKASEVGTIVFFLKNQQRPDKWKDLAPGFIGAHQEENLDTVLATLAILNPRPSDEAILIGIPRAAELTGLRARLERHSNPEFDSKSLTLILDAGHNADAMKAISEHFLGLGIKPIVIAGFMKDKDVATALAEIGRFASHLIAVQCDSKRAMSSSELSDLARANGIETVDAGSTMKGVGVALTKAKLGETILITGSHYVIGEFLANESQLRAVVPLEV
jgi:dihydrofolate synthase / folylpolyglutamate synthase